jgi:protein TonB
MSRDSARERAAAAADVSTSERPDEVMALFLEEEDKRPSQWALVLTCAFFTILFLVSFPAGRSKHLDAPVIYVPPTEYYIPPVKQEQPKQIERKVVQNVRKIALPDPTPDEPEPIREPLPEPEPEPIPENAIVLVGVPRAPPSRGPSGAPVTEGTIGLVNPQLVKKVDPEYPLIARRAGVGGTVHLRAIIDKAGRVTHVELLKGLGKFGLDEAAIEAVKQWVYTPGQLEGRPVDVVMTIRVVYEMQ